MIIYGEERENERERERERERWGEVSERENESYQILKVQIKSFRIQMFLSPPKHVDIYKLIRKTFSQKNCSLM